MNPRNRRSASVITITATSANGVAGTFTIDLISAYPVTSAADIQQIRNNLNGSFTIPNNIDLIGTDTDADPANGNFTPVGTSSAPFTGIISGNGRSIRNMTIIQINTAGKYLGFIGYNNGRISNLNIDDVQVKGDRYVGAIAGYSGSSGVISYCNSSGTVYGGSLTGGLIGMTQRGSVDHCSSTCAVSQIDIPGETEPKISFGGLIGYSYSGSIEYCNAKGDVTAVGAENVGGLTGWAKGSIINWCYTTEIVRNNKIIRGDTNVGGLIGCLRYGAHPPQCSVFLSQQLLFKRVRWS